MTRPRRAGAIAATIALLTAATWLLADHSVHAERPAQDTITEIGGGGDRTFPMTAINDEWGLSAQRTNCSACHTATDGYRAPGSFNRFGRAWRRVLFTQIAPDAKSIFDPSQAQRRQASRAPSLLAQDSDRDGYDNGLELMFGSWPGRAFSHPSRKPATLKRIRATVQRRLAGQPFTKYEGDPRVTRAGTDTDRDRVPDALERFAGFDPRDPDSTPLTAARTLAIYHLLATRKR